MTELQQKALEHVDKLLIDAHNEARGMDEDIKDHTMFMRADELAKHINEIQMWCRAICNDPQNK